MGSQEIRRPCINYDSILHEFLPPITQQNRYPRVIQIVLKPEDIDRIIEMAWEDRTPFDAIFTQFGLREDDVKALMKRELHPNNWRKWRARVHGRVTKHRALAAKDMTRFKCSMQRSTGNRIAKRG